MNTDKKRCWLALLVTAVAFLSVGALSDALVTSVAEELLRRERQSRMLVDWFSPITGIDAPVGAAYFRGRADQAAADRELLLRASGSGSIGTDVVP